MTQEQFYCYDLKKKPSAGSDQTVKELENIPAAMAQEKLLEAGARTLTFHCQDLWLRAPSFQAADKMSLEVSCQSPASIFFLKTAKLLYAAAQLGLSADSPGRYD